MRLSVLNGCISGRRYLRTWERWTPSFRQSIHLGEIYSDIKLGEMGPQLSLEHLSRRRNSDIKSAARVHPMMWINSSFWAHVLLAL